MLWFQQHRNIRFAHKLITWSWYCSYLWPVGGHHRDLQWGTPGCPQCTSTTWGLSIKTFQDRILGNLIETKPILTIYDEALFGISCSFDTHLSFCGIILLNMQLYLLVGSTEPYKNEACTYNCWLLSVLRPCLYCQWLCDWKRWKFSDNAAEPPRRKEPCVVAQALNAILTDCAPNASIINVSK